MYENTSCSVFLATIGIGTIFKLEYFCGYVVLTLQFN